MARTEKTDKRKSTKRGVMKPRRRNPADSYHDEPPTAPTDTMVWGEEVLDLTEDARRDPQLRMLLGGRTLALLDRVATAPRREKFYRRVPPSSVAPVPVDGNEDWDHIDRRTGQPLWPRSGGAWVVEEPHPPGAFTLGEMVELEARLWGAGEAFAQAAEQGFLDERQRRYAVDVVEAADDLSMRLAIMRWKPDEATRERVLREVLKMIVNDEPEPPRPTLRVVKNRLMR